MIRFAPCKINLGLHVLSKRSDGYHNIETCFYPVPWLDALEIIPASGNECRISMSGKNVPGNKKDNLVLKAWELLSQEYRLGAVNIHLHKTIPTGAGLGGGSSNAASALILLDKIFGLGLTPAQLVDHASTLGSDCAFFMHDKPMIGVERGNVLSETTVSLKGKYLIIVKPSINVSTVEAYAKLNPAKKHDEIRTIVEKSPLPDWKETLHNDFEETVFESYPGLADIKDSLYDLGAVYASMSGSGSAVYGIFDGEVDVSSFSNHTVWSGSL